MMFSKPEIPKKTRTAIGNESEQKVVPIAIVGKAFRFPGDISTEEELWKALKDGRDLVTEVPSNRWAVNELWHPRRDEPGRSITFSAGVLSDVDKFDAEFFGISPREAAWMDPQQRLLLELAWEAMENAGILPSALAGSDCAVYVGISSLDYGIRGLSDLASMSSHSMTGNALSIAANRLSYFFDFHGPSLAIDTACSSSLVALHHACNSLRNRESSVALVGGVNLLLHPYPFIGFTKASMLSAAGRCKPFDASGDGYVRAEGGAVLLLKLLGKALEDGDHIEAVILASGVNADGARKAGMTIPSTDGQIDLMQSVMKRAGLEAADIDFVEAHGTGTAVGDPVEMAAIGQVYGLGRNAPLPVGSAKAHLGHMEPASGMAGLLKAIVALKQRALPPQLHLSQLNPNIDFNGLNLRPMVEYLELSKEAGRPLVAGVNSFGFGGANAHVLLQEFSYGVDALRQPAPEQPPLLYLSARSEAALRATAAQYSAALIGKNTSECQDIFVAAANLRDRLEKRLCLSVSTFSEAPDKLAAFSRGQSVDGIVLEEGLHQPGSIAFIYSGNGTQWFGMGQRLMAESARFAEILRDLDQRMASAAGFSLLAELHAEQAVNRLADTVVAQPLLFALQVGITLLLREQGVVPEAVAGHSVGEIAAAWASGALDLDTAIQVIVARSRAQGVTRGTGRMAAIGLTHDAMEEILAGLGGELDISIAAINSPSHITVSGSLTDLERVQASLLPSGIFFRLLDLDYAFHSRHMEVAREALLKSLAGLKGHSSHPIAFVSTVAGAELAGDQLDADYWWRNIREPVRFADATSELSRLGCRIFVEIGPHAILQNYLSECLAALDVKSRVLPSLRREADGVAQIIETAARVKLLAERTHPDNSATYPRRHVRLPNYPWQRERHWHPETSESFKSIARRRVHPLLGWPIPEIEDSWENILDPLVLRWLADHKVGGAVVFPGSAYAEMAMAAASEWLGGQQYVVENLDIVSPMLFDGEHARTLRFELLRRDGSFQIKSRERLSNDEWQLHATGRVLEVDNPLVSSCVAPLRGAVATIDRDVHYRLAAMIGLQYRPSFQGLQKIRNTSDCLEGELEWPSELDTKSYFIHPAILDVCYQSLVDVFRNKIEAKQGSAFLPVKIGRLEYHAAGIADRFRTMIRRHSARSVLADFDVFDSQGHLLIRMSACRFQAAPLTLLEQERSLLRRILPRLRPHPLEERASELPGSPELAEAVRRTQDLQIQDRRIWFKETLPLFEALVLSFAKEACQALTQSDPVALDRLFSTEDPYIRWLAGLLQQEGLLIQQGSKWSLQKDQNLSSADDIWRSLLREHTGALPQLVLLGHAGRQLPALLSKEHDRRKFLEALGSSFATDILHDEDPAYSSARQSIESVLHHIARQAQPHRRLRVLEITPGISGIPRSVLSAIREDRISYVLASTSTHVLDRHLSEYAQYPNLTVASLDLLSWQLSADRPLTDTFDVVIIRHMLHRAANPREALQQTRRWVAEAGCLLIAERHPDWSADFLAGLDSSWWRETEGSGMPCSSLMPPSEWLQMLDHLGYTEVMDFKELASEDLAEGAYLMMARNPRLQRGSTLVQCPESWLLLTDQGSSDFAKTLAGKLTDQGHHAHLSDALTMPESTGFSSVVNLRGWDCKPEDASALLSQTLAMVQTLAVRTSAPPRLWLVTRGGALASELPAGCTPNLAQAALWGFGRVVMNEHPDLNCTLIELACDSDTAHALSRLECELGHPDGAREIILSESGRYTLVLHEDRDTPASPAGDGERFRLDFKWPGQLKNLVWLPQPQIALGDADIEVRVHAAGVNFRDVMYVLGLLPEEVVETGFAGANLGLEFSGIVSRVGSQAGSLKPGDKVVGFGSACFATHVVTRANAVVHMPDGWTFESAATVPTVFFTAYYALKHLANLQPGERVLIHGGAGGVGIAAIQLAHHLGAEVFATAGSDEKRDFVHLLGAERVFDSRSLDFADQILTATLGEGIDVVLNSLSGEAIRRNFQVLKPFGRFLELGKRDFVENTTIGLRPLRDNISYFAIDADQLLTGRLELAARLFQEVMVLFREGALTPLPSRTYSAERIHEAFRAMQQARHIGKLVISLANARPLTQRPPKAATPFRPAADSTWIVAGGLSGFGLESARWLVAQGVTHLALLGRRGWNTPGAREAIDEMMAAGANIEVHACDLSDRQAIDSVIRQVRKSFPPIRGVLHAAAVFEDALVCNIDEVQMERVVAPKLLGAWNLHQATLGIPLEHFILYSSFTTVIGNPGQASYVAANGALEGLAELRRQLGLPGICIGWGPIGDSGHLARNEAIRDRLSQHLGKPPFSAGEALGLMEAVLAAGETQSLADIDWEILAKYLPSADQDRFMLLNRTRKNQKSDENDLDLAALINGKTPQEVSDIIQRAVIRELAQILGIGGERINPERALHDLGLDSLMGVELALALEQRLKIKLPAMLLSESQTVEKIAKHILEKAMNKSDTAGANEAGINEIIRAMGKTHGEALAAQDIDDIAGGVKDLESQIRKMTS